MDITMNKVAYIFPGQGAQYMGMGKDFYEQFEESRQIFERASDLLNLDIRGIIFEEEERLHITEYTQVAIITTIAAMLTAIKPFDIKPELCAGLSLGEYGALLVAGVLSFDDAIPLIRKRGIFMQEAVPAGGSMAAVLGLDNEMTQSICEQTDGIVSIANYNCPGQLVISGETEAVKKAGEKMLLAGAKRVIPLNVSGPFHSKLLADAGEKLYKELEHITVSTPMIPYVANVTAGLVTEAGQVKDLLRKQVASSVKWQQSVETMIREGITTFVEIGPGKTLSSFVKKINKEVKVLNIDKVTDLGRLEELKTKR